MGELLQGPRVQVHRVRRLVPRAGKVHLFEFGEPPATETGSEKAVETVSCRKNGDYGIARRNFFPTVGGMAEKDELRSLVRPSLL